MFRNGVEAGPATTCIVIRVKDCSVADLCYELL
jgi:hypothetical protein